MNAFQNPPQNQKAARQEVNEWQKIVSERPNDATAYARLAKAYAQVEDLEAAADAADHALELDPGLSLPHFVLGYIHTEKQRPAEAESQFQKALSLDPHSAAVHYELGRLYFRQQEYSDATNHLEQAVSLAPQVSDLRASLASTYFRIGRFGDAAREAFTILRQNPLDGNAYRVLGWLPFAAFAQSKAPIRLIILLVLCAPLLAPRPISLPYWIIIAIYGVWLNIMVFKYSRRSVACLWTAVTVAWLLVPFAIGSF